MGCLGSCLEGEVVGTLPFGCLSVATSWDFVVGFQRSQSVTELGSSNSSLFFIFFHKNFL